MSLYGKKLYIKKPGDVIQKADLYTDKSDVGNNYLTFKDIWSNVYTKLDINGNIDLYVKKIIIFLK